MNPRLLALTTLAMICFAANSVLCRMALAPDRIDPASFTSVRALSAALMLAAVVWIKQRHLPRIATVRPASAAALFGYLIFFSFAYGRLTTGTGALLLFGAVQMTMFAVALKEGERFSLPAWGGLGVAVGGLVYLVLPGVSAPDPIGAAMMAASGLSWGIFSLLARGTKDPVEANARNFFWCVPPALMVNLGFAADIHALPQGLALAIASGAVTSGLGYVIWYMALRDLPAGRAATVQLSVPALAALGGVAILAEPLTARLMIASALMLGGIGVVLSQRSR